MKFEIIPPASKYKVNNPAEDVCTVNREGVLTLPHGILLDLEIRKGDKIVVALNEKQEICFWKGDEGTEVKTVGGRLGIRVPMVFEKLNLDYINSKRPIKFLCVKIKHNKKDIIRLRMTENRVQVRYRTPKFLLNENDKKVLR